MTLFELIEKREMFLKDLLQEKKSEIKKLPEGRIRAAKHKGAFQYYLYSKGGPRNGEYVPSKELEKVKKMVLHEYDEKLIKVIENEFAALSKLKSVYVNGVAEDVYGNMPMGKQKLISPIVETEEEFVVKWMKKEFRKKGFSEDYPEYYSQRGVRMRSKAETMVASVLDKLGLNYIYEMPLTLKNGWIVHPDFTIIDGKNRRIIYYEHFGLMDKEDYANKNILKIKAYQETGIVLGKNLIASFETLKNPIDMKTIEGLLRGYFEL